jgi:hypothetical protein
MNFYLDFLKILVGSILGSSLTNYFNLRKSQKDLCLRVYERWISNPLYQERNEVLSQLQAFFNRPVPNGFKKSDEPFKLSGLQYLSKLSDSERLAYISPDLIEKLIHVMIFFADLNKLMKFKLIDIKLAKTLFKDTILPWYQYFDQVEFDEIEPIEYNYVFREVESLKKKVE